MLLSLVFASSLATAQSPDISLPPTYGSVTLKGGAIKPHPFQKDLVAGGPLYIEQDGVKAYVAKAPDFQLHFTPGTDFSGRTYLPLQMSASSAKGAVTLLINLPDGKWVASAGAGHFQLPPQKGRYDIYVGTVDRPEIDATLTISEFPTARPAKR